MHIITLSFDDGFLKSNLKIAEIYERFGLSACFNVLAAPGELEDGQEVWGRDRGDFALWNDMQQRGHEIMPHGYRHANKRERPFEQSRDLISRCLDILDKELDGFERSRAVFNFPYNQSTPELDEWLPSVVKAFRTAGPMINALPTHETQKLTTGGHGPDNCEEHLEAQIAELLSRPEGWLIYNTHGLDDEGWGPIRASYLQELLGRLTGIEGLEMLPSAAVLNRLPERQTE